MARKTNKALGIGLVALAGITLTLLIVDSFGLLTANINHVQWLVMSFGALGLGIYLMEKGLATN